MNKKGPSAADSLPIIYLDNQLAERVRAETGENVYLCYQCVKCTSGCPVAEFFDWQPNQIMRAIQLGQADIALDAETPWLCASCQTCTTRCPQGLNITAIMEFLTREALEKGYKPPVRQVPIFNQAFMREVRLWGRAYELGLMAEMKLRTGDLTSDLDLGLQMFRRRKISLFPKPTRTPRRVRPAPGAHQAAAYYPGCSLHSTATEFDHSTRATCRALGLQLVEPHGWVCCGSSAAHRSDPDKALRLPMVNLSIIEQSGYDEVAMPCAACFNRHKAALHEIRHHPEKVDAIQKEIGYRYQDRVRVNTMSQTILSRIGAEGVAQKVKRPLDGLKVVTYYGCLLTRPPQVTEAEHPENPVDLDILMRALGVQVLDWSYKTSCCGAAHSLTRPDIVLTLSSRLIESARQVGAEAIVVACPLCHTNLDARQIQMKLEEQLPVLYFTQLMALALGLSEGAAALQKNMIDPRPLLRGKLGMDMISSLPT
jgi:heterodisulfide reductase subunit B